MRSLACFIWTLWLVHLSDADGLIYVTTKDGLTQSLRQTTNEAEQIALEVDNWALPPPGLVDKIAKDLILIRARYPEVRNVIHQGRWTPGEVLVSYATEYDVERVNGSEYGPLRGHHPDVTHQQLSLMQFNKPYNPVFLKSMLRTRYGIISEPNGALGTQNVISYQVTSPATYHFQTGWGDCETQCINKHYWIFTVSDDGRAVKLRRSYGRDLQV